MKYKVEFTKKALKAFLRLSESIQDNIVRKIDVLSDDPYSNNNVKKLQGIENCYRLRVGDYRVLYRVLNNKVIIEIINIAHRKEVYQ